MTLHRIENNRRLSIIQVLYERLGEDRRSANIYIQHVREWRPLQGTAPTPLEPPRLLVQVHAEQAPWGMTLWPSRFSKKEWVKCPTTGEFMDETFNGTKWYDNPGSVGVDHVWYKMSPDARAELGLAKRISIVRVHPIGVVG